MNLTEEQEIKKEFQLERVILFSDAVFAIIITIMVIDLKLPEAIHEATTKELKHVYLELLPKFASYIISFVFVAIFWIKHLKIFSYLKDYDTKLLACNLFFLFAISMFPFAANIISSFKHMGILNFNIYVFIVFGVVLAQTILVGYMVSNKARLCIDVPGMEADFKWKVMRLNLVFIPLVFVILSVFNYLDVPVAFATYTPTVYGLLVAGLNRRLYKRDTDNRPLLARMFSRKRIGGKS